MEEEKNVIELQTAKNELNKLVSYRENLMEFHRELKQTLSSLDAINKDNNLLFPIGSSMFIESKISNWNNILVGIGSNVFLEMEIERAKDFLNKKIKKIEEEIAEIQTYIQSIQYYILSTLERLKRKK